MLRIFRRRPSAGCGPFVCRRQPQRRRILTCGDSWFRVHGRAGKRCSPVPRVVKSEARAIENVLGRYRIAFNKLDAGAASAVWPTVNEKTLAKAFERLESHDVSFASCQIEIFSVLAEAACSGSARYVPKVGSRTPKDEARRWRFSLRKASGGWLIDSVDAR